MLKEYPVNHKQTEKRFDRQKFPTSFHNKKKSEYNANLIKPVKNSIKEPRNAFSLYSLCM